MNLVKDYYIVTVDVKDPERPTHWDRTILDGKLCVFLHEIMTGEHFFSAQIMVRKIILIGTLLPQLA